jgi:hypothetical protein
MFGIPLQPTIFTAENPYLSVDLDLHEFRVDVVATPAAAGWISGH